jgi:predicted dehydrogenase
MLVTLPVKKALDFPPRRSVRHFEERTRHGLRKLLYFAAVEGPIIALRKAASKLAERKLEEAIKLVVALVESEGQTYVGFTRWLGGPYVFDTRLVFASDSTFLEGVRLTDAVKDLMESYLPVPSCPLLDELPKLILESNPQLKRVRDADLLAVHEAMCNKSAPKSVSGGDRKTARPDVPVYLLGFGSYVREYILPHFEGQIAGALDYRSRLMAHHLRGKGFSLHTNFDDILEQIKAEPQPLVLVATYHSDHAWMAERVLEVNPEARVFIEKPPVVDTGEAMRLAALRAEGRWIDVGFNRRYAPLVQKMRMHIMNLSRPLIFSAIVKEPKIPRTHWYFWQNQGTRITGNVCHWIDLAFFLIGSCVTEISLLNTGDSVSMGLVFQDGSLATIVASDVGYDLLGVQELIEVRGGDTTLVLNDFRCLSFRSGVLGRTERLLWRDRGHDAMYRELRRRVLENGRPAYPMEDLLQVSTVTSRASEMLLSGKRHWLESEADRLEASLSKLQTGP